MKKILLFIVIIGGLVLTGCGSKDSNVEKALSGRMKDYDYYEYTYITDNIIYFKFYHVYEWGDFVLKEQTYNCTTGKWVTHAK